MTYLSSSSTSTIISQEVFATGATGTTSSCNYKIKLKVRSTSGTGSTTSCFTVPYGIENNWVRTYSCMDSWGQTESIYEYEFYDNNWSSCCRNFSFEHKPKSIKEKLSDIIRSRNAPVVITDRKSLINTNDIREQRARETLKRVIGENKFINFIKNGFITIKAKSGLVYQIFPGHGITSVYNKGQKVDRLCVVLQGNFPPTDSLIMRYLLILNNEEQFRSFAIKHSVIKPYEKQKIVTENKNLADIYKELKSA